MQLSIHQRSACRVIAVIGDKQGTACRLIDTVLGSRLQGSAYPQCRTRFWQADDTDDYAILPIETEQSSSRTLPISSILVALEAHSDVDLAGLPSDELAILNGDDPRVRQMAPRSRAAIRWIGEGALCDVRATNVRRIGGRVRFEVNGERFWTATPDGLLPALAAIAVGLEFGLSTAEIQQAINDLEPPPTSLQVVGDFATRANRHRLASPRIARRLSVITRDESDGYRIALKLHDVPTGNRTTALSKAA